MCVAFQQLNVTPIEHPIESTAIISHGKLVENGVINLREPLPKHWWLELVELHQANWQRSNEISVTFLNGPHRNPTLWISTAATAYGMATSL